MLRFLTTSVFLLVFLSLQSCIETYDIRYDLSTDVLTVEGLITDQPGTIITIKRSRSDVSTYTVPVKGCTVEVLAGNGTKTTFREVEPGAYASPANFRGVPGQTYQLLFRTPEGANYESTVEQLTAAPAIKKTFQEFNAKGLLDNTGNRVLASTFDIFVDFDDPIAQKNFYLWKWQLFERQDICVTCEQGYLDGSTLKCIFASTRFTIHPTYDYACGNNCWDTFYSSDINVLSDVFSNGKTVTGRKVAQVPYYSESGALIEIQQYAISNEAYQYYVLLRDQTQTTGTLADTPPAPIVGNIKNTSNRAEIVVGYFGAAGLQKSRYWVEREGYANKGGTKISLLGRAVNLEPASPFRPPFYPCIQSLSRTPVRPEGWR
jgi:Domain of unknown function (DUF4249)